MSDVLRFHFPRFAAAEGLTVNEAAEMVKSHSPNYPEARPAWRAIGRFCKEYQSASVDGIARQLGRARTEPKHVNIVQKLLK